MILNKFTDTVFLKQSSELEKQIQALKWLLNQYPDNENLQKQLKLCELGLAGEKEIEYELKSADIGMFVLHDITLQYEDMKAQIDYIVITPAKMYFIECKNLIGNITVNSRGDFIREYTYKGRKIKEGIYSPMRQSEKHMEIDKKIWAQRRGIIISSLFDNTYNTCHKPIVVIANPKCILNLYKAPQDVKYKVIKSDGLVKYLKRDLQNVDYTALSSKNDMQKFAERYLSCNVENYTNYITQYKKLVSEEEKNSLKRKQGKMQKQAAINNIEKLKEKLFDFRLKKARVKGIPAYYIFTNDELDGILKFMPKTLVELKSAGILANIKIKLHGQEIVDIINKKDK